MPETRSTTLHSLETLKTWIKVQGVDPSDDPRLVIAADAATSEIERELDVYFVQRAVSELRSGDGKATLILQYTPVVSIESLTIGGASVASSAYALDPDSGIIALSSGVFTSGVKNIAIAYTAGFDIQDGPNLPADIYRAAMDLTKAIYDELTTGAIAATSVSLGASTMVLKAAKMPPSARRVLDNWEGTGYRP